MKARVSVFIGLLIVLLLAGSPTTDSAEESVVDTEPRQEAEPVRDNVPESNSVILTLHVMDEPSPS